MYRAIVELRLNGCVITDPPAVIEQLRDTGRLDEAGGYDFIGELLDAAVTSANVAWHCDVVRDRWIRRRRLGYDRQADEVEQAGKREGSASPSTLRAGGGV